MAVAEEMKLIESCSVLYFKELMETTGVVSAG